MAKVIGRSGAISRNGHSGANMNMYNGASGSGGCGASRN